MSRLDDRRSLSPSRPPPPRHADGCPDRGEDANFDWIQLGVQQPQAVDLWAMFLLSNVLGDLIHEPGSTSSAQASEDPQLLAVFVAINLLFLQKCGTRFHLVQASHHLLFEDARQKVAAARAVALAAPTFLNVAVLADRVHLGGRHLLFDASFFADVLDERVLREVCRRHLKKVLSYYKTLSKAAADAGQFVDMG